MAIHVAVAARNAGLNAIFDRADAGAGPGTIKIYAGVQPVDADTIEASTLLATITLADPAWSAAVGGIKDLDADPDMTATAVAAGSATWARCEDSNGGNVFDGSVGTSGTDVIINSTDIVVGQVVKIILGSITDPA